MTEKYLLSILIPVYNASKWLERCLDSIVSKSEFKDFVRLICINDGSKDDSLDILERYKKEYGNMEVVSRENRGIGATRNELLGFASTPFFWFVDADDYISNDAFPTIIPLLESNVYDMIMMGYYWGKENDGKDVKCGDCVFNTAQEMTEAGIYNNSLWNRVYRTSIIKNKGLRFQPYQMGEDFDFIFKAIPYIGKVKCIDKVLYKYIINPDSAITAKSIDHKMRASEHSLLCMEDNYNLLLSFPEDVQLILRKPLNNFLMGYLYSLYSVPFTLKYKKESFYRLVKMGAVPVVPLPMEKKRKWFSRIINIDVLRVLSLYIDNMYLKMRNG